MCIRAYIHIWWWRASKHTGNVRSWLMIAFITCNSNLVPLLEGLCSSNPCRFEFSIFRDFAGIPNGCRNPATMGYRWTQHTHTWQPQGVPSYCVLRQLYSFKVTTYKDHRTVIGCMNSPPQRGIEETPAGFHHPRCLAVGGIQNHIHLWNMNIQHNRDGIAMYSIRTHRL